jgi:hypothetical protein
MAKTKPTPILDDPTPTEMLPAEEEPPRYPGSEEARYPVMIPHEYSRPEVVTELRGLRATVNLYLNPLSAKCQRAVIDAGRDGCFQSTDLAVLRAAIDLLLEDRHSSAPGSYA